MTHHLMGAAEIGARLGLSRQRVSQIAATDPTFPAPIADLAAGRVWESDEVERWIADHRRRPVRNESADSPHDGGRSRGSV